MGIGDWFKSPEQKRKEEQQLRQLKAEALAQSRASTQYTNELLKQQKQVYKDVLSSQRKNNNAEILFLEKIGKLYAEKCSYEMKKDFADSQRKELESSMNIYIRMSAQDRIEDIKKKIEICEKESQAWSEKLTSVWEELKTNGIADEETLKRVLGL